MEKMFAMFKRQVFDPSKLLNDLQVHMTCLELCKVSRDNKIGYYDSYKNGSHTYDLEILKAKKFLTISLVEMADEAENRLQTVGTSLGTHLQFVETYY